ncbi:MAG: SLC13 family permease [Gammaproteobacteria bacterium]|nr:SLC13 family permease [Gammaproteobacteria bacterium]
MNVKAIALIAAPLAALAVYFAATAQGAPHAMGIVLAITTLVVCWWILEPIPLAATSFIPIIALPLSGVLDQAAVSQAYGNPVILLLLGGFILSTALAKSGTHRRIALSMVRLFGVGSSRRLVFGFMAASALLSMWISNTATTLMMLPIALAVLERTRDEKLAIPLLLGIAYASSIGGIGTPIGTPPNLIFRGVYEELFNAEVGFLKWMSIALPVVLVLVPVAALWLCRNLGKGEGAEIEASGAWRPEEKRLACVFGVTVLLWVTRTEPFGGWSALLGLPYTNDAMVALFACVLLFIVPNGQGGRLLDWETAEKIPWGTLILFASGIALAKGFEVSGVSAAMGNALSVLGDVAPYLIVLAICLGVTFLTEATSNTATTTLLMPIMGATAVAVSADPLLFMIPAAMSASCAFMLPVATAPNVIMFSTGRVPIARMVREGVVLNFVGAAVISVVCYLLIA